MYNWDTLDRIAERKHENGGLGGFAGALPQASAYDFDEIKRVCCKMRASSLTSVDAVTIGTDGRLYFIEFKDTERFPLGSLRRKAFDSLVLFWMSLGSTVSFDELCQRSVFVYVRPDGTGDESTADDEPIFVALNEDASMPPPVDSFGKPIENRLNELRKLSLYADVWTISASEFSTRYRIRIGIIDQNEFCRRIGIRERTVVNTPLWRSRLKTSVVSVNRLLTAKRNGTHSDYSAFCHDDRVGDDFSALTDEINEIRCPLSAGGAVESKRMVACDVYQGQECRLVFYHDWDSGRYKFTRLVNTVFDGFIIWCVVYNAEKHFEELREKLSMLCVYEGAMPLLPEESRVHEWQKSFWGEYRVWCSHCAFDADGDRLLFGLQWFVDGKMYKDIKTLPMVDRVLG